MSLAIVWLRRDLRLADNPALHAACAAHERVLPVYIHAPQEEGDWAPGAASRWWLRHSLAALRTSLHAHHAELHLRVGDSLGELIALIKATGAEAVYWNRLYEPAAIARDTHIKQALREQGVAAHSFNAALWREPWQIATKTGDPYRVFTPYWRNLRTLIDESEPLSVPQPLRIMGTWLINFGRGLAGWSKADQGRRERHRGYFLRPLWGSAHRAGKGEAEPGDSVITTKDELPKLAASFCGLLDVRTEAVIDAVGLAATLVLVTVLLLWLACSTGGYLA